MAFTRDEAVALQKEIAAAVQSVLDKHDLVMGKHRASYGDTFSIKIEVTKVDLGEDGFDYGSKPAQDWMLYGRMLGFTEPKDVLGKEVRMSGADYVFLGYAPRSTKYPLLFRKIADGKTYKFTKGCVDRLK